MAKALCKKITKKSYKNKTIDDYKKIIFSSYPNIKNLKVFLLPDMDLVIEPFKDWEKAKGSNPKWWSSYNNVKHERSEYFQEANLGNVFCSIAGLVWMVLLLNDGFKEEGLYESVRPKLFFPSDDEGKPEKFSGHYLFWDLEQPSKKSSLADGEED